MGKMCSSETFQNGKRRYLSARRLNRKNAQKRKRCIQENPNKLSILSDTFEQIQTVPNNNENDPKPSTSFSGIMQIIPESNECVPQPSTSFSEIMEIIPESNESVPQENNKGPILEGRRVVDIKYFLHQIAELSRHPMFDCTFADMEAISEQRLGLQNKITFKCKMCNIVKCVHLNKEENDPLSISSPNNALALATISTGTGYSTMDQIFSILNIPFMTPATYQIHHEQIAKNISSTAWEMMIAAGKEEANIAQQNGEVDKDGVPLITVIADGAWAKRSYGLNYNSASGVGCIIGAHTHKILFMGVRNKYCSICDLNSRKDLPLAHKCFKNWEGTSTSMETDIIVEGFKVSMEMHRLKYWRLIGDGDSSVYKRLLEVRPYGNMIIQKIECRNHLLRNFSKKIREICARKRSESKNLSVLPILRKIVENSAHRLRTAIKYATLHRINENVDFSEKVKNLIGDIKNIPSHVFGEHRSCKDLGYFNCSPKDNEKNHVPSMRNCGLMEDMELALNRLITNSNSLIINMTNNPAEQYNSVVCKFVGGKRINFSLRGSYEARCKAASLSFNAQGDYLSVVGKNELSYYSQKYAEKNKKSFMYKRKIQIASKKFKLKTAKPDKDYGPEAAYIADMTEDIYQEKKKEFIVSLTKSLEEIVEVEKGTQGQAYNPKWQQERILRLTSSHFGEICKLRKTTSCVNKIKSLLYQPFQGNSSTKYGTEHEPVAKEQFQKEYNIKVTDCGLIIYQNDCTLAASPDGFTADGGVVEIKCPSKCAKLDIKTAIQQKILSFCTLGENSQLCLKKNHNYYYQIQGQLQIANRKFCYIIVWSPLGMMVQKIEKDDKFWHKEMVGKLKIFYDVCLLPELVDPRFTRNMEIRNPPRSY